MSPTIHISEEIHIILVNIKYREKSKNMDGVIRFLLKQAKEEKEDDKKTADKSKTSL
jgi:hypothetical protein